MNARKYYKENQKLVERITKLVDRLAEKDQKIYQLQIQLELFKEQRKEMDEAITIDWSKYKKWAR